MATFGNSPSKIHTVLHLEARKSFSLGVRIKQENGAPIDITDCTIRFVMKPDALDYTDETDATNLIDNAIATLVGATEGFARFDFQAADLDEAPGEYGFAIVLWTAAGYSVVLAKGVVNLLPNTEFASLGTSYTGSNPSEALDIVLRGTSVIEVRAGSVVPPGLNYVTDEDVENLALLQESGLLGSTPPLLPPGGFTNQTLVKLSNGDYDVGWAAGGSGGGGLDATGVPAGYVPTANGADNFTWGPPAETQVPADWNATTGVEQILNKPVLGTAAAEDVAAFAPAAHTHRLVDLSDVAGIGTAVPTGGTPGQFYIRIPAV